MSVILFFGGAGGELINIDNDPRFTGEVKLCHDGDNFNITDRQNDRTDLNDSNNIELKFFKFFNNIIRQDFPLESQITSAPLFVNASEFPTDALDPGFVLTSTKPSTVTDTEVEFRANNTENTNAQLNTYKSVGDEFSSFSSNEVILDAGTSTSEWFTSDPNALIVDNIEEDGIKIRAIGPLANKNFIYRTFDEVTSPVNDHDARYLTVDVVCDRIGEFLEMQVQHGLSFNNGEAFGFAPDPFRNTVRIEDLNKKQTLIWDISDWPSTQANEEYIRALVLKVTDASDDFTLHFKNWRLFKIDDFFASPPTDAAVPTDTERFLQYRISLSSTTPGTTPEVEELCFRYKYANTILPNRLMRQQRHFVDGRLTFPKRNGSNIVY